MTETNAISAMTPASVVLAELHAAPGHRGVVLLVCIGTFMTTLDASIVNIGLPTIARAFHTPVSGAIEWVVIAYLVVIAALLLTFGRISDLVGRRPVWTAGLVVFVVGSALCGAASSLEIMIGARIVQGIGAALMLATSTAILSDAVAPRERGRAFGWNAVAVALGGTTGPTLGGLLTQYLSWRWIFYVNIPVGIGAIATSLRILPRIMSRMPRRFDLTGALFLATALTALNIAITFGARWGWRSALLLGTLALGVGSLTVAVLTDRGKTDALLDLALLRQRVFASALASLMLATVALFAVAFLFPFYLEDLRGLSTAQSGRLLTPYPLTYAVVAPVAGALADRFGSRWLAPVGLAIAATVLILLAQLDAHSSTWSIAWRLAAGGFGMALFMTPNTRAVMSAAPVGEAGEASGLLATARITGQSLSVAMAGAVLTSLGAAAAGSRLVAQRAIAGHGATEIQALEATFLHGYRVALFTCAAFATMGALAALGRGRER
ncbi:MAG TPA: MFS transporter [Gemmatimonadaceae bacterium]|nr:MFS transporter [Gemmatimonadaceae bacterium]